MKRITLGIAVVLVWGAVVRAQDADTARLSLDSAERQLSGATNDAINARRELDYALTNQRQVADAARNTANALDDLRLVLDDPGAVDRAIAAARVAAQQADERAAGLKQVQDQLDASAVTAEQYRSRLRTDFENAPAYVQAAGRLGAAQDRLDDVTAASQWALGNDPEYQRLALAAQFFQARVEHLRNQNEPDALSRASQTWINAESDLGTYEQAWLENDPRVIAATTALAEVRAGMQQLERRFDADLAADARHVELVAMRDARQRALAAAAAEFQEAVAREQEARADVDATQRQLQQARQQYENMRAELDMTYTALDNAATSVVHADRRLRDILIARDRAAIERDRAFRDLRLAQDDALRLRDQRNRAERIDQRERDSVDTSENSPRTGQPANRTEIAPVVPPPNPNLLSPPPVQPPVRTDRPELETGPRANDSTRLDSQRQADELRQAEREAQPRQDQQRRETESREAEARQQRIEDSIRRASDAPASDSLNPRERSPGTYRPAGGSVR